MKKATPGLFQGTGRFDTVGDWLRFAVSLFNRHGLVFAQGTPHAGDEALALLRHALGFDEDLSPFLSSRLTPAEIAGIKRLLRRRIVDRIPLAYLTGTAQLGGLDFAVDARVLIPRSYFVELMPDGLAAAGAAPGRVRRILEIGTGSGCLAILLAHAHPQAIVDATDVSEDAIEVAAGNIALHGLGSRVHLLRSDLFESLPPLRYDLIASNPPYEPDRLVDDLPPELRHEPRTALAAGPDGMDVVRRILREARAWLTPRGLLAVEVGELRPLIEAEFPSLRLTWPVMQDGTTPVLLARAADL